MERFDVEIRRLDERRDSHVAQDEERWTIHRAAHTLGETSLTSRLDKQNELVGALDKLGSTMATRREVDALRDSTRVEHTRTEETFREAITALVRSMAETAANRQRQILAVLGLILSTIVVAVSLYAASRHSTIVVQVPSSSVPTTVTPSTVVP